MSCVGFFLRMFYFYYENDFVRWNVFLYDFGFLEEDGISVIRKMRNFVDLVFLFFVREGYYFNLMVFRCLCL